MPRGSVPGERRGGRPPGGVKKATVVKETAVLDAWALAHATLTLAFAQLGPDKIDTMSPANLQLYAMRELLKLGHTQAGLVIADRVAPYFDPKLASEVHRVFTDDSKRSVDALNDELADIRRAKKDAAEAARANADAADDARASDRAGVVEDGMPEQSHSVVH